VTARRHDSWLVAYEITVCFDTDLGRTRFDYVGTSAHCQQCGHRLALGRDVKSPEALVGHARLHERENSLDDEEPGTEPW
jgi:hypothetical protein